MVGRDSRTVMAYCGQLVEEGWLRQLPNGRRVRPVATIPKGVEEAIAEETHDLISMTPYWGEECTWRFVDWIVAPYVRFVRHARPDLLRNPKTGYRLEYDIYAPSVCWAVEYYGDQHFAPTSQYPDETEFIERHKRDLQKASLSEQNDIRLSIVTKSDLTLKRVLSTVPDDVPRSTFNLDGPYVSMLERVGNAVKGGRTWDRE
ncbi:MAG: hypothetical protein ACOX3V_04190 [Bacillota bacterium]